ncbi:MAG: extracellular solute-binding protein [Gammaproteobacteria bacterium]|nr:extracellular solute-binding protein [Gammaproteobacteria bacterium]
MRAHAHKRSTGLVRRAWSGGLLCLLGHVGGTEELEFSHGISLLHELKYGPDFEHFDYVDPNAPKGGTMTFSSGEDIRNFAGEFDNTIAAPPGYGRIYDTLIVRSGDELGGFYGRLAEGVAVTDDRLTLVFRLHPGARFHDGEPVTADDVKFTFDWALATIDGGLVLSWIDSVEVTREREVRVHLKETLKDSHLRFLTAEPRILPEHHWRGRNPSQTTLVEPVGSGPYRIERWARDHIAYRRVEDYWGRHLPVTRGLYNFDQLHFDVYRDATVLRESLRKGLIDYYVENDVRHWAGSYDTPAAHGGFLRRGEVASRVAAGMNTAIGLNSKRPPLDDVRVREALTVAFDFDWLNRALHAGAYQRAFSYFPNSAFGATGLPTPGEVALLTPLRDRIDPRVFSEPFHLPASGGRGYGREALSKAQALLAEAGWQVAGDRLVNAAGEPFEIEFIARNIDQRRILIPYTGALRRLGIAASIRLVEVAQFIRLIRSREFDAIVRQLVLPLPPMALLPFQFSSAAASQPMTSNLTGVDDPAIDALIDHALNATDMDAMVAACRALDRVLLRGYYHIPLEASGDTRIVYWDRFGQPDTDALAVYESPAPNSWWYDRNKAERIPGAR